MNQELLEQVQVASQHQPAWLQKKRQLAILRSTDLPTDHWQEPMVDCWQKRPNLTKTKNNIRSYCKKTSWRKPLIGKQTKLMLYT